MLSSQVLIVSVVPRYVYVCSVLLLLLLLLLFANFVFVTVILDVIVYM